MAGPKCPICMLGDRIAPTPEYTPVLLAAGVAIGQVLTQRELTDNCCGELHRLLWMRAQTAACELVRWGGGA